MSNTSQSLYHLEEKMRACEDFFEKSSTKLSPLGAYYRKLLAKVYRWHLPTGARVLEIGCGSGRLLCEISKKHECVGVDISKVQVDAAKELLPDSKILCHPAETLADCQELAGEKFDCIIISDTVNYAADVQRCFEQLRAFSHPGTRLLLNFQNNLWRPIFSLLSAVGLRKKTPPLNWLSDSDVRGMLELSGWEILSQRGLFLPFWFFGLEKIAFRYIPAILPFLSLSIFQSARAKNMEPRKEKSVSVLIPARNEAGNIEDAIRRMPRLGSHTEVLFVEGNSKDNTWEEIQRVASKYKDQWDIRTLQQSGKGKGNAVREGFSVAKGDIFMILDADLTVPPEDLPKFYEALVADHCEYANGVRLVYPMEKKAMRFLNMCGNKFFSMAFSWVLGQSIKDTLCGTKVLSRENYFAIQNNRSYFGDFDPFGDFDVIFGAAKLQLKFADIPIRYKERVYGDTNIDRWAHGWLLLKMLFFSLRKVKFAFS